MTFKIIDFQHKFRKIIGTHKIITYKFFINIEIYVYNIRTGGGVKDVVLKEQNFQ